MTPLCMLGARLRLGSKPASYKENEVQFWDTFLGGVHRIVLFQSEVGLVFTERLAFTDREKNWEEELLS